MKFLNLRAWEFGFSAKLIYLLTLILYLMLSLRIFSHDFIPRLLLLIFSIVLYGFFAITFNDFFGKAYDIRAGKRTGIEKISDRGVGLLLSFSVITCLLVAGVLAGAHAIIYLFGVMCTALYSHPKPRFKERGILGPIFNSLAELAPFLFILAFFNCFTADTIIFAALYWFICLTEITHHQLEDYRSDKRAKLNTFALKIGYRKTVRIIEITSILAVIFFFFLSVFFLRIEYFYLVFSALICYCLLHPLINPRIGKDIRKTFKVPFYYIDFINIGLFGIFPLYFGLLLFLRYPPYLLIFLLTIFCSYRLISVTTKRIGVLLKSIGSRG